MTQFSFSDTQSPDENIRDFFQHIRQLDPDLAPILENCVVNLLPFPQPGPARNAARQRTNSQIEQSLDSMTRP